MTYRYKKIVDENSAFTSFLEKNNVQYIHNLYTIQENERIIIARDLHDSIGQKLSVIKMIISEITTSTNHKSSEEIELAKQLVDETVREVRSISYNLLPTELRFGLIDAIEGIAKNINAIENTQVEIVIDENLRNLIITKDKEISIFRIVQEILNNILKHAVATKITIHIYHNNSNLQFFIKDNGKGFNVQSIGKSKGIGWQNIFARIKMINGTINIGSEIISGTHIELHIPFQ